MNLDLRRRLSWPFAFAVLFFLIAPLLVYLHPSSFWVGLDYNPLGLADALNLAYRIADLRLYPAPGMWDHPGVPFYFMSWLALAFTGYPVASGSGFLDAVVGHIETYHRLCIWLAALAGAVGVYVFARAAQKLVPNGVVIIGLLIWLVSSPATLTQFTSPSIDSFAIVANSLFFVILVRLAYDEDVKPRVALLCGCVGAFAYLNKLSYIYIPFALAVAGFANAAFRDIGWIRVRRLTAYFTLGYLSVLVAVGVFIIGSSGFLRLLRFHRSVILGAGLYGTGDRVVVSGDEIWRAVAAIPVDKAYAIVIALLVVPCLVIGGLIAGRKGPQHTPAAVISIGTGLASALSAVFVMKHYGFHYTAGVSATLPACVVACCLLARSFGYSLRIVATTLAAMAILFMASQAWPLIISGLVAETNRTQLAEADLREIRAQLSGSKDAVEFSYRAPFSWYGEGFVVAYASVPRLNDDYIRSRQEMFGSMAAGLIGREPGAYVIDKAYFPTVESVKAASNVAPFGPKPVTFGDDDKLIELRTVFLLIRG